MGQSEKNPSIDAGTPAGDGEEIDRIMKEIEDLEKKMDEPGGGAKVVQMHPAVATEAVSDPSQDASGDAEEETVVETSGEAEGSVMAEESLLKSHAAADATEGGLALKIGGCTDVSLEFSRAGMSVTLSCTEEALTITTDQGAEFRIPFRR